MFSIREFSQALSDFFKKFPIQLKCNATPALVELVRGYNDRKKALVESVIKKDNLNNQLYALKAFAQAVDDCSKIFSKRAFFNGKELFPLPFDDSNISNIHQQCLNDELINKDVSRIWCLLYYFKMFQSEESNITNYLPIETSFFYNWHDSTSYVDNKEIADIFGRLLFQESCKSDSISKRTLHTIKNLTQEEALLFKKLSCYILDSYLIVPVNEIANNNNAFNYSDILKLIDAQLIVGQETVSSSGISSDCTSVIVDTKKFVIVFDTARNINTDRFISGYKLTRAGIDLYNSIDIEPVTTIHLAYFSNAINSNYPGIVKKTSLYNSGIDINNITKYTPLYVVKSC